MRTFRTVVIVGALGLLVSACSALIPDQTLNNPLGLNNKTINLNSVSTAGLATQAASTTTFSGSTTTTFPDQDLSGVPSWANPNGFTSDISATGVTIKPGDATTLPQTLNVTRITFGLKVTDGSGAPSFNWSYDSGSTPQQILVLTRGTCGPTVADGCTYSVAAGSDLSDVGKLIVVSFSQSQVTTLMDIIGGGTSPNDVTANASVTVDQALSGAGDMDITLGNATGTLTF